MSENTYEKNVSHPAHYTQASATITLTFEPIDLCELYQFNVGNALKYLLRAEYKGKYIEDLQKAQWYLERELERIDDVCATSGPDGSYDLNIVRAFRQCNPYIRDLLDDNGEYDENTLNIVIQDISDLIAEHECAGNTRFDNEG